MGRTLFSSILLVNLFLTSMVAITTATIKDLQQPSSIPSRIASGYIVHTENPGKNPEAYYLRILTSALGSTNAAKRALLYSYTIIHGFFAKLTPHQAYLVAAQRGVLQVVKDKSFRGNLGDRPGI